jgi:asparagine synthase (glutamine-hydrolysing)
MSGLCGVVDFAVLRIEPEDLRSMAESASYRAPAGIGYRFLGEAGFAHLALHSGAAGLDQPLVDSQSQVCVVLDGRLDNRPELIARLEPAEGSDASDVQLLLAAYLEWGVACTDHLLGDFAFAVWDAGQRRLLCAVDPLGIKPLHYARVGPLVCFASDAVQVLHHREVPDDYNEVEIAAYLASQCEDPARSFFAAIYKLAPGQRLIAERGDLRVERYWFPKFKEIRYARDEDYAAHFLEILQRAVTDRLRDVGSCVGVAMSGGLDSTSVAALAQRASGPDVRAYTFVFDRLTECDERAYSQAMTKELGLEVEPIEAEFLWSLDSQATVPFSPDTPFIGWRTCYKEILGRLAARGSRVLLLGHGGDDLIRGSSLVYFERLRQCDLSAVREVARHARSQREPLIRTFYRYFGGPYLPAAADRLLRSAVGIKPKMLLPPWIQPSFARRIDLVGRDESLRMQRFFDSPARQATARNLLEMPWYWRLVNWHERSAAAMGVEVRHPFLDRRLVEFVLAIPGEQLFRLDVSKNLLRRAMAGLLPERIRQRARKTSFTPFLELMVWNRAMDEVQEILRSPLSADLGIVDGEHLRAAYLGFVNRGTDELRRALWCAITLEIWLRRCDIIRSGGLRKGNARSVTARAQGVEVQTSQERFSR